MPFVSRRNCSRLNKRRRLCRLRAVTDAAESMEAAVAAAAAAAARDLTNAAAAANEFFVSSPLVRIVASQIDIGDRSSFAGSGTFRIPLFFLFSGLRRFVYTSCGGLRLLGGANAASCTTNDIIVSLYMSMNLEIRQHQRLHTIHASCGDSRHKFSIFARSTRVKLLLNCYTVAVPQTYM